MLTLSLLAPDNRMAICRCVARAMRYTHRSIKDMAEFSINLESLERGAVFDICFKNDRIILCEEFGQIKYLPT
jgi:hypothetical protein